MKFTIRELSKEESKNETDLMFKKVEPYLKDGHSLFSAVREVTGITPHTQRRWYQDLNEYCTDKGYDTGKNRKPRYGGRIAKLYYPTSQYNNRFAVYKTKNYRRVHFGVVEGEAKAKAIVKRLNQIGWDESQFDEVRKEFGV